MKRVKNENPSEALKPNSIQRPAAQRQRDWSKAGKADGTASPPRRPCRLHRPGLATSTPIPMLAHHGELVLTRHLLWSHSQRQSSDTGKKKTTRASVLFCSLNGALLTQEVFQPSHTVQTWQPAASAEPPSRVPKWGCAQWLCCADSRVCLLPREK